MLDPSLLTKLDSVCRRQRIVSVMHASVGALIALGGTYTVLRALSLALYIPSHFTWWLPIIAASLTVSRLWDNSHTRLKAAQFVDRRLGLHERLGTAVEFASYQHMRSPLVQKLHADASRYADTIQPRALVPYRLPRWSIWLIPLLSVAIALGGLPTAGPLRAETGPTQRGSPSERHHEVNALLELAEQLERGHDEQQRPQLLHVSELLRDLVDRLQRGEITDGEFWGELAALEDQLNAALDQPMPARSRRADGGPPPNADGSNAAERGEGDSASDPEGKSGDDEDATNKGDPAHPPDGPPDDQDVSTDSGGSADAEGQVDPTGLPSDDLAGEANIGGNPDSGPDETDAGPSETEASDGDPDGTTPHADSNRPDVRGDEQRLRGVVTDDDVLVRHLDSLSPVGETGQHFAPSTPFAGEISGGTERSVDREAVPPAFRHWVQLYFERLSE